MNKSNPFSPEVKRSWAGEVRNVSVLVAIGVGADGYRRILGVAEGDKEDKSGWGGFLRHLKERGLNGNGTDLSIRQVAEFTNLLASEWARHL